MDRKIIKYHGSKWRIAEWIISHFPDHRTYVDVFGGSGAVMYKKRPAHCEIFNDLSHEIVGLFRIMRCPEKSRKLFRKLSYTPYSRLEYFQSRHDHECPVERARRTIIRHNMGIGTTRTKSTIPGFASYVHRADAKIWANTKGMIQKYCQRFKNVTIENRDFEVLIPQFDSPETLFYLDPPYLPAVRTSISGTEGKRKTAAYDCDMTLNDHHRLLDIITSLQGMVIISGYDSQLYSDHLKKWRKEEKMTYTVSGLKRKETIWLSPNIPGQQELF